MSPTDLDERELRIAPVMTGGTSLAVWMGGATAELYRLLRSRIETDRDDAGARIYRGLLEVTRTRAVVDVITGTSAGGLNGTLLGAGWMLGVPVDEYLSTRETWLDIADLELLLRSPGESDPPSLLEGDDHFLVQLRDVIDTWWSEHGPVAGPERPIDMVTTVTTIVPEPRHRVDHFGESLSEVDHAQWLRFTNEDFARPGWVDKLAVAARTSASIPGVFEPSYLPVGEDDARRSGRPDFAGNASFGVSRWAVDGGTVVNLPLGEALDRIFGQSADIDVRRVVLYVCPTPSELQQPAPDPVGARPSIRTSLATVVTAPRAEGISADVDQLQRHNAAVERQARLRRTMAGLVDVVLGRMQVVVGRGEGVEHVVEADHDPFVLYRRQRADASVRRMVDRVRREVGPVPLDPAALAELVHDARIELLPERIDQLAGPSSSWGWGISPVEEAVSIALGLIGRTMRLVTAETSPETRAILGAAKLEIHEARAEAGEVRRLDEEHWRGWFAVMPGREATTGRIDPDDFEPTELLAWAREGYAQWPVAGDEEARYATFVRLAGAHLQVANAITAAFPAILEVTLSCGAHDPRQGSAEPPADPAAGFAQAVLDEALGLFASGDDPRIVQRQLLRIHVTQTLLLGDVESREQRVELMQLSWNAWNALDPDRLPNDKLAGPELARLGAFLKPSWRANDWFWGRMDAAHRLCLLLLDPARLAQLHPSAAEARAAIEEATGVALSEGAVAELAYLDHRPATPVPAALQLVARDVARAVQTEIARAEIPVVAAAVAQSGRRGANTDASAAFAASVPDPDDLADPAAVPDEQVAELVRSMRIGQEAVGAELGFSLMNRALNRGVAVTVNALTGRESGLPLVSALLRPLRAPIHAINSVVSVMTSGSRLARGATAFILAAAGALVALRLLGIEVPSGTFTVAAVLFIGALLVAMLRSGFVLNGLVVAVVGLIVAVTAIGPDMASIVYSEEVATEAAPLGAGTAIDVEGPGVVRITRGSDDTQRIVDIEVDDAVVELRGTSGSVRGEPEADHVAGWKRWGAINLVSVGRVALLLVALLCLTSPRSWTWRLAWAGLSLAVAALLPWAARHALTGRPDTGAGSVKSALVDVAQQLDGYGLEIVILAVVGLAVAVSLGADLWARRVLVAWRRR